MSADTEKTQRPRTAAWKWLVVIVVIIAVAVGVYLLRPGRQPQQVRRIRIGITPYQDTALPVVGDKLGWYAQEGISVEFVPLAWGDVMLALSSNSIDVSIYTINSFQAPYQSAASGTAKPIFYCPIYMFKGTAIMVHENSGMKPFRDVPGESSADRDRRVSETARQLRGKRIAVTEGTEYEQIVLAALSRAGLDPKKDVTIIHSTPDDALAAFLSGNIDAFGAGLTERIEAKRHGGTELLVASDVGQPSLDGIVTTEKFANENRESLDKLLKVWFRTINFMETDLKTNSKYVTDYLAGKASTHYSPEEYAIAWTFNVYPNSPAAADDLFNNPSSPYYWKTAWNDSNDFLLKQQKISSPVPTSAYWGETVLKRLKEGAASTGSPQ